MASRADTFDRADSASSLGTPSDAGAGYSVGGSSGATWGISSNKAYNPGADSNATAVLDAGTPNADVQVTLSTFVAGASGVSARWVDATNYYTVVLQPDSYSAIVKVVAGSASFVGTGVNFIPWASGDVLKMGCDSSNAFTIYRNGTAVVGPFTDSDAALVGGQRFGLFSHASAATRFDDLTVTAGGGGTTGGGGTGAAAYSRGRVVNG